MIVNEGDILKSKDLEKNIENFVDGNYRSILIDGPWGCGKTYIINKFLKYKKRKNIIYVSLFGKENIDEIHTEIYKKIHSKRFWMKKIFGAGLGLVSKAVPVNGISGIGDRLDFALNNSINSKIKKNKIVILDDLERVSCNLSYISILGYLNQLFLSKIRVICICSSENVRGDDDFNEFKEKAFDRLYVINESNNEIIENYFSKHNFTFTQQIFNEFDSNLRLAKKVAAFYDEILSYCAENNINIFIKFTDLQLLKNCIQALKICFNQHKLPTFPETNDWFKDRMTKEGYNSDVKIFGENIANGLFYVSKSARTYEPNLVNISRSYIVSLIFIFLFDDYNTFDNQFKPRFSDDEFYFMSDENKRQFSNTFINEILSETFIWNSKKAKILAEIILYESYEFSEETKGRIIEKIVNAKESIFDNEILRYTSNEDNSSIKPWVSEIKKKREEGIKNNQFFTLQSLYETKKYADMVIFLSNISEDFLQINTEQVNSYILNNNFLLPNLSGNIKYDEWLFCRSITEYSQKIGKNQEFIDVAVQICMSDLNNKSLLRRFSALATQLNEKDKFMTCLEESKNNKQ